MSWTKITKASGTSWTKVTKTPTNSLLVGTPIGLLLVLTYATSAGTNWSKISKPTTSWTKITKPL